MQVVAKPPARAPSNSAVAGGRLRGGQHLTELRCQCLSESTPSDLLQLAGFSVLFVVETGCSPHHGIGRCGSQCQQRNPLRREGCIAPGGFAAASSRQGTRQPSRDGSPQREVTLSNSLGCFRCRPSEGFAVYPHTMHEHSELASNRNLGFFQTTAFG